STSARPSGTLALRSRRNGVWPPTLMVWSLGSGRPPLSSATRSSAVAGALAGAAVADDASDFAANFRPGPSAETLVLLPIRMIVNETVLPAFAKLSTTMLALLITDERESQPCSFIAER